MVKINIPNPGSKKAIQAGCTCAPLVNYQGQGFFMAGAFHFCINENCPLHGKDLEEWDST